MIIQVVNHKSYKNSYEKKKTYMSHHENSIALRKNFQKYI